MFLNAGMGEIEAEKRKKARRVTTSLPPKLYEHVAFKAELHGSMSAYLRYLVLRDREGEGEGGEATFKQTRFIQTTTVAEFSGGPRGPPARSTPGRAGGYGSLHGELLKELKAKLKPIQ